ncbi:MAG: flagellar motor switch protein FliM [Pseudomonadota bacterium]|nr:MAG: flagellar motor switch protein FliM [Desulfobacteraceae bacterium]
MSEILSQEEVDSLLSGLSAGKIEAETDKPSDDLKTDLYDFASQERVIRGRMPTFEVINERFAREIRATMSSLLHKTIDISAEAMETLKFGDFIRSLPVPTSLHLFRMDPLRGHALMVLETQLVFNLIDTFFGGKATGQAKIEGRDFTKIEETMVKKVVIACLKDLEEAWEPVEPIKTVFVKSEVNPQFAAIVLPTDLVIVTKFEIELEQSAGMFIVCLPYAMLEPLRSILTAGFQAETLDVDRTWQKRLREIILDSKVDVRVQLGTVQITGERLIHMKTGDIIQLDQDADGPLTGMVEGFPKLEGYAGVQRGFQAFRVTKQIPLE